MLISVMVFYLAGCDSSSSSSDGENAVDDTDDQQETVGELVINEIVAKDADGGADWIELYVVGNASVALGTYSITDDSTDREKASLPDLTLAPGEFIVIQAVDEAPQDGSYYVPFKLGSQDAVFLYKADAVVDSLDWADGDAPEGYSYGRLPDGSEEAMTLTPTPGAANQEATDTSETDEVTQITLNGNSIAVNGVGATADGGVATITSSGSYRISGSLVDGQIIVNTQDTKTVTLILNGADIKSSTSAPIFILNSALTAIVLQENTNNYITDATAYIFGDPETDEPNAAIFSKSDLTIEGNGSLTVEANFNDGISSKDGLTIISGTIHVTSIDDGIRGKDYLIVKNGNITVNAEGDGLKSDNDEDAEKGYISIEDGVITLSTGGDAIQAQTDVEIADGEITLSAGGGSINRTTDETSAKGIKASAGILINGGNITVDSADDAVNSNGIIEINGGTFDISTGDDGFHADTELSINGGDIRINSSYEGIESALITINDGNIHIISSDDGINIAGGNDGSGTTIRAPGPGGFTPTGPDGFAPTGNYYLYINGGNIVVDADGDGIDANGSITMTGGLVIINGPTENFNGALDYDASFKITGGFLLGAGSAGMAQAPDQSSTQYSLLLNFNTIKQAGTLVQIQTNAGAQLFCFKPTKNFQSIAFSSPSLSYGTTYDIYYGGSSTGTATDGLYSNGTYMPGTQYASFTISRVVTDVR